MLGEEASKRGKNTGSNSRLASKLDISRSGIDPASEHMPLSSSLDMDGHKSIVAVCFVAEIEVTKLHSRICSSTSACRATPDQMPSHELDAQQ